MSEAGVLSMTRICIWPPRLGAQGTASCRMICSSEANPYGRCLGMDQDRFQRMQYLFTAALEHPPESRSEFLRQAAKRDSELIAAVEKLLAAHREAGLLGIASGVVPWPRFGPLRVRFCRRIKRAPCATSPALTSNLKCLHQGDNSVKIIGRTRAGRNVLAFFRTA